MEVPGMNEVESSGSHLTSAAAFVEGGIQEACEDACSICLEAFCENDPSSVTSCKHEYHLQCILEWCQRSSSCPMCWQPISLKDPASQELLEAVEQERSFRANPARNSTIFRHPTLGDFELQHLPVGVNDLDLEDRIIQHLAAAAAMGRAHHIARREGSRGRSSSHGRPQFLVFSTHPNSPNAGPVSASIAPVGEELESGSVANPSSPISSGGGVESPQHMPQISSSRSDQVSASSGGSVIRVTNRHGTSVANRSSPGDSSTPNQDRGGPSDLHSLSENWKSRFSALSTRYKESISKSTKGWKDKLFTKSTSMADIGSEVKREVNAGIASVSRMMERLETRENNRGSVSLSSNAADSSATEQTLSNRDDVENHHSRPLGGDNGPGALATN